MKIERGVPLPPRAKYRGMYSSLEGLRIGTSMLINRCEYHALVKFAKRSGIKMVSKRTGPNKIRVWRLQQKEN